MHSSIGLSELTTRSTQRRAAQARLLSLRAVTLGILIETLLRLVGDDDSLQLCSESAVLESTEPGCRSHTIATGLSAKCQGGQ